MNGQTQVSRTAGYLVLTRHRATALFEQLLDARQHIEQLTRSNLRWQERCSTETNLLVRALHELALSKGEEPQLFIRRWLSDRREARLFDAE